MVSAIRKHINPVTILALAALVFAVTGGAYAAIDGGGAGAHEAATKSPHGMPQRGFLP
jgi:hypothetical protein